MAITRRRLAQSALAGALLPLPAMAQPDWPNRPVRIIVPFGVGGSADLNARLIAKALGDALGQPFVVDNRPGGGATIGTEAAVRSPADGYTLLMMSNAHTANETLIPKRPYQLMRDLSAVAAVNVAHHVLVVHTSLGVSTLPELIARAKSQPGTIDYASSGPGTPYHIATEVFRTMAGIEIQHVPYKSSGEARTSVIAGQVPMMFDAIPTMQPHIAGGRVVALATTGSRRDPLMPEVPTVAEAGLPGYEASIWLGLMAPAATPRPVIDRVHAAVTAYLGRDATREAMVRQGAEPLAMSVDEFDAFLRRDVETQRAQIQMARIAVE